jgi:hypothetical protein
MIERVMNTNATKLKASPQPKIKCRCEYKRYGINVSCNLKKLKP